MLEDGQFGVSVSSSRIACTDLVLIVCILVNGIHKGVGTGGSKQVAKEEAARQAYYAMGWT
jgi:hypothetical protein